MDCQPEQQQGLFDLIRAELEVLHGKVRVVEAVELAEHPGSWVSAVKLRLLVRNKMNKTLEETR